jgi:hypothetical protein
LSRLGDGDQIAMHPVITGRSQGALRAAQDHRQLIAQPMRELVYLRPAVDSRHHPSPLLVMKTAFVYALGLHGRG